MSDVDFKVATNEGKFVNAIKELRLKNFNNNLPFLILSDKLPEGQVYQEFRDGHIELQEVFSVGSDYGFKVIKTLTTSEADQVHKEYGLF